ncbi:MAG: hypothetical protein ACP5E4_02865, partial [Candidatus Aenigmatarchaeota archaeon]
MNGKRILELAAVALMVQMALGVSMAFDGNDCNMLNFYNYINSSNSNVVVYQNGVKDVTFTNNIEVRHGSLDFAQYVSGKGWTFTNEAYLEGKKVTFQGVTLGAVDCSDKTCGEIQFNQHIEVDGEYDPWIQQKFENYDGSTILEQGLEVLPGGWLRVDQAGYVGTDNGVSQGFLSQAGKMHGRDIMAWQAGLVDGNWGYSSV